MNTWRMHIKDVLKEIEDFGFRQVLDIPFMNDNNTVQEHMYVYFYEQYGIVLQFDTSGGDHVNGGHYYYQWSPHLHHSCLSSGGWVKFKEAPLWEGYGDCREGMFGSIKELARDGDFKTPWINAGGISSPTFVHYMDHRSVGTWQDGYDLYVKALKEKTPERFKLLPVNVQEAIKNNMRFNRGE